MKSAWRIKYGARIGSDPKRRCDTVREPDGLALSSRNLNLSDAQRADAPRLRRALLAARDLAPTGEQRPERFGVGDKVDVRVTNIDNKTRRLGLSIKAREIAEEKEAVEQYGSSDSGASLGDILGAALQGDDEK